MPLTLTDTQLLAWLDAFIWPFIRIGAMLMVAPIFGVQLVPARARLLLALAFTAVVLPALPEPPHHAMLTGPWFLLLFQQLAIGIVLGFVLRLVFEAVVMGGELVSMSMGLSFAQMADPLRGAQTTAISQFYLIIATLLFLALDGHLGLLEMTARSFTLLPVGAAGLGAPDALDMAVFGGWIFLGGVQIALPAMTALLLVNLAFGVMSRSAPTLNALAVGFPVALIFGSVILVFSLPTLRGVVEGLLGEAGTLSLRLLGP